MHDPNQMLEKLKLEAEKRQIHLSLSPELIDTVTAITKEKTGKDIKISKIVEYLLVDYVMGYNKENER